MYARLPSGATTTRSAVGPRPLVFVARPGSMIESLPVATSTTDNATGKPGATIGVDGTAPSAWGGPPRRRGRGAGTVAAVRVSAGPRAGGSQPARASAAKAPALG